eukprot:s2111_g6.t1
MWGLRALISAVAYHVNFELQNSVSNVTVPHHVLALAKPHPSPSNEWAGHRSTLAVSCKCLVLQAEPVGLCGKPFASLPQWLQHGSARSHVRQKWSLMVSSSWLFLAPNVN